MSVKKGDKVRFSWSNNQVHGSGVVISDPDDKGTVLVAWDPSPYRGGNESATSSLDGPHVVIHCNITWLWVQA